jgi:3-oxoacyl-[acyl-carrier protein] reductase
VVVTGGGSGLGFAIARAFARLGDVVVINGRTLATLERAQKQLRTEGLEVLVQPGSVANIVDVRLLVARTIEEVGPIDVLVNNAGIVRETPLLETSDEQWDATLDTNLKGVFLLTREAAKAMVASGKGGVVLITSSIAAIRPESSGVYGVSKAAVDALVRGFALELAPHAIRVCAVQPGYMNTPMAWNLFPSKEAFEAWEAEHVGSIPLGRHAEPEDIASSFVFLASEQASYITGSHLLVDGGFLTAS